MRTSSISSPQRLLIGFSLVASVALALPASARSLRLDVGRVTAPGLLATGLSLSLDGNALDLKIDRAQADAIG